MISSVFTLCSNNYLAHAAALGESILKFNPDTNFIIGLVDQLDPSIDYSKFSRFEIIPCFDLGYEEFDEMLSRYNIIEFNTAVKPYYFEYLFRTRPEIDRIYYIDPDILLYQPIEALDKAWESAGVLVTPNLIYLPDTTTTGELASLRHGVNNLGFIGIKRGIEGLKFLQWWKVRLRAHCRIDKCSGIFVDQKWVDLAPLFFDTVKSIKHPGWNMGWWNFSERMLKKIDENYYVNSIDFPLVFFHFSGFKPGKESMTERIKSSEFDIESEGILRELFDKYELILKARGYDELSVTKPLLTFHEQPNEFKHRIGRKLKSKITNMIYMIFKV